MQAEESSSRPWFTSWKIRLACLAAIVITMLLVGKALHAEERLSGEQIRHDIRQAGVWGPFLFMVMFTIGELLHVPGLVFIAAAVFVYGRLWGGCLAFIGALVAVSVSFLLMRCIGGTALADIQNKYVAALTKGVTDRPLRTVICLRLFFITMPWINTFLALNRISYLDFLVGSGLGLMPPVAAFALAFDWMSSHDVNKVFYIILPLVFGIVSVAAATAYIYFSRDAEDDKATERQDGSGSETQALLQEEGRYGASSTDKSL
mmetsp:Transcript_64323/g.119563  ORF Transcript_64323/g.119563 Transcript_64323/m.119563 type:complete len:262 (+) Transcript_64323:127-912(+)